MTVKDGLTELANDVMHAAGHAHMDICGFYNAPAIRAAVAAALREMANYDGGGGFSYRGLVNLADEICVPLAERENP